LTVPDRHRGGGSSPTVLRQRAEHRKKGREQTGARRARRVILTRPEPKFWRARWNGGNLPKSISNIV
jgi:hypothetical protein